MQRKVEALVTPRLMEWARKKAGLTLEIAAKKIGRPKEDIEGWENDTRKPTICQARKAEEVYKVPLACFYMEEPPKGFSFPRDFRSLPEGESREFSPALIRLIEDAYYRQEWLRDQLILEGHKELKLVGSADLAAGYRDLAKVILRVIGITPADQQKCLTRQEALRVWINSV